MCSSLPIVEQIPVSIDAQEQERLDRLAREILAQEPALSSTAVFGSAVQPGLSQGACLFLEDHSEVALFAARGNPVTEYRSLLLAHEKDAVAIGARRHLAFEAYCREVLQFDPVTVLSPTLATAPASLATRSLRDPEFVQQAVILARRDGCLTIVPYMGSGRIWRLAATIAARARTPVFVAAPPPRLTQRVNDKLWFAQRVVDVFGKQAIPATYAAFGSAALTARVAHLSRSYQRVGIKLPDSASAAGNIVLDSSPLRGLSASALQHRLLTALGRLGWKQTYPLLVAVWECPVVASPSVQLWIPAREAGLPLVEGIFDQNVEEQEGAFVGAMPTTLPETWCLRLAHDATRLGVLLQALGYFGRCSFDAILVGEDTESAVLHWVECNGRWGATSIPMTLANRLAGNWRAHPFVTVHKSQTRNPALPFAGMVECVATQLYRPPQSTTGVVFLTPYDRHANPFLDFMVLADTVDAAIVEAAAVTEKLA